MIHLKDPLIKFSRLKINSKTGIFENTSRKKFKSNFLNITEHLKESVTWAIGNKFQEDDRPRRIIIENALVGKLGEFAIYKLLKQKGYNPSYPDLSIRLKGHDGGCDLTIPDVKNLKDVGINVKGSSYFSNTLLLKKGDFDSGGNYKHMNNPNDPKCYYFFLARISPRLKNVLNIDNDATYDIIMDQLDQVYFQADVPGYLNIKDIREIISQDIHIKGGSKLNSKDFKINQDSYYCQAGDFRDIDSIPDIK